MKKVGKVEVEFQRCKACGLCVHYCPQGCFALGTELNHLGAAPVRFQEEPVCTACGICAVVCPDLALQVWKLQDAKPVAAKTLR